MRLYKQQHLVTLAPVGRLRDESLLNNHILPALGKRRLCDIGTEDVQSFLNEEMARGLSWWSRRAEKAVLSLLFVKAEDRGIGTAGIR